MGTLDLIERWLGYAAVTMLLLALVLVLLMLLYGGNE